MRRVQYGVRAVAVAVVFVPQPGGWALSIAGGSLLVQLVAATVEEFYEHLPLLLQYLRRYSSTHTPHGAVVRSACCTLHAARSMLCVARWRFATCNAVRCALAMCNMAVCSPEYVLTYRLLPGTMAIFDNHRVLHGRTAFSGQVATLCMNRHTVPSSPMLTRTDRTMRRDAAACN
jgi:hypothetical protein